MKQIKIGGMYEPFGTYTLHMAKQDSDRLLWARRLSKKLKAMNREAGYTIVSLLFAFSFGLVGLVAQVRV